MAVTVSSNQQVCYFINGTAAGAWDASGLNLALGPDITLADNTIREFDGMLDEVQIWNVARFQGDIHTKRVAAPPHQCCVVRAVTLLCHAIPQVTSATTFLSSLPAGRGISPHVQHQLAARP